MSSFNLIICHQPQFKHHDLYISSSDMPLNKLLCIFVVVYLLRRCDVSYDLAIPVSNVNNRRRKQYTNVKWKGGRHSELLTGGKSCRPNEARSNDFRGLTIHYVYSLPFDICFVIPTTKPRFAQIGK